jgi:hypothetical protein
MRSGPRHKPHDKWSEVETCFGSDMALDICDDDGDGGEVVGDALDEHGGDALDDGGDGGQVVDDKLLSHLLGDASHALDDKHQKGEEAPQDDQGGQAAGRAGSWGGVSGKGRLEIPERVRDVVGAAYLRCLHGWRVSNLPTRGLQHVLDTVFKACPYHTFLYLFC